MGRLLSVALIAVAVMAVAVAAFALGAFPVIHDHFSAVIHDRFSDTFTETDFCESGLTVMHTVRGVRNITEDGFKATGRFRDVITNPDNRKSVIVSGAGQFTDTTISGDPEHVHTHLFTSKGLPSKVQTAHGSVLFRDAGLIAFGVVFDGDAFTSSEVANKGPHSEAHSDFTLFCDTVVPALV